MLRIKRILRTVATTLSIAVVVGMALPAQAQMGGRPGMKKFSLKKAGPKAGAGSRNQNQPFQGMRAPGASGGAMMSGSGGMTSQSKTTSPTNRPGSTMTNRPPNRARR